MIPQDQSLNAPTWRRRDSVDSGPSSPPAADSFRCNSPTIASPPSTYYNTFRAGVDIRGRGSDLRLRRRRAMLGGRVRRVRTRRLQTRNVSVKVLQSTEQPITVTMELAEVLTQTKPAANDSLSSSCEDKLPLDPRQWSREDVQLWLRQMSIDYDNVIATPDYVITDRFPMNGKGLCLMARKPEMFETRVPCGGLLLFNDFRSRLLRAVTSSMDGGRTFSTPTEA